MAKTRKEKEVIVKELVEGFNNSKSTVFANFQGLTVPEMEDLRDKCREESVQCMATKKTLLNIAAEKANVDIDAKSFEGGSAVFFGLEDSVAPAKIVANFAKDHDVVKIFGGVLDGEVIDAKQVKALAELPSREELYAKLVGSINAPVSGFVNVLAGNLRSFVNVLNNIKDAKSEA